MVEKGSQYTPAGNPVQPELGYLIRNIRTRQGLKGKDLANRLGISPAAVSQWERGVRTPTSRSTQWELLAVLNPNEPERGRLLELMDLPINSENVVPNLLDIVEKRLIQAERISTLLQEEIAGIKSLVGTLRKSSPHENYVNPDDISTKE